jgi:hypothetical protein
MFLREDDMKTRRRRRKIRPIDFLIAAIVAWVGIVVISASDADAEQYQASKGKEDMRFALNHKSNSSMPGIDVSPSQVFETATFGLG